MEKQNIYDLNFDSLKNFLIDKANVKESQSKMRAQQILSAVYKQNIKNFDELTTFSLELREKIKNLISLEKPKAIEIQKSTDGTIKFLLSLKDKRNVETVLIPDRLKNRYTICISVSVACALSCNFCATGQIPKRYFRNLSPGEIVSQIVLCKEYLNDFTSSKFIKGVVVMGQGSAFFNLSSTKIAIDIMKHKNALNFGRTRITVSTVGLNSKKDNKSAIEWAAENINTYIAWSLHSSLEKQRAEIMPVSKKHPIKSLIPLFKTYYQKTKLPIFIEYIALEDNLSELHAKELIKIMKQVPSKLNLIEFNPLANKEFKAASKDKIEKFSKLIQDNGFLALLRKSKGRDINGSCGSLANSRSITNG